MNLRQAIVLAVACAVLAAGANAQNQSNKKPTLDRIDVTRWMLSHGRLDKVRPGGIATDVHTGPPELVSVVAGITPTQPQRAPGAPPTIPPETPPGALPYTILDWIDNAPDKTRISLQPHSDQAPNPIIMSGANMPSCFSLLIAEGLADPDGHPVRPLWRIPRPRFGAGNVYATVSIYDANGEAIIKRGQELVTPAQFEAYTANSVLYEGPDVGFPIVDNQLDGGTTNVGAHALDDPPPPGPDGLRSEKSNFVTRLVGFADPLQVEIVIQETLPLKNGAMRVRLIGQLDNNFEPVGSTYFRWAFDTNQGTTFLEVAADNTLTVDFVPPPDPTAPPDPNAPEPDPWIYQIISDPGLVKVTLVASAYAPFVPATAPTVPPFVRKVGELGDVMLMDSFSSVGCTLSDTEALQVKYDKRARRHAVAHSICILLDASGSMGDDNKMEQAKASASRVLRRLGKQTEVALIVYYDCSNIKVEHKFTTDVSKIIAILPNIHPSGSTPLAGGTAFAKDYMRKHASGTKLDLIVLTDGEETCGGDPIAEARN